jgi:hypothetical protein
MGLVYRLSYPAALYINHIFYCFFCFINFIVLYAAIHTRLISAQAAVTRTRCPM